MNPTSEIITIGDEILIGQTVDTNSAWIGERMSLAGIPVRRIISITDQPEEIRRALTESLGRADVVLITGGLGPTSDDRTKATLADFFDSELVENEEVLGDVLRLLAARNVPVSALNRAQAMVPHNCRVIRNPSGTAPGMWFDQEGRVVVAMPGVPYEMKSIMQESVLPLLSKQFTTPVLVHRTILTTGIAESRLSSMLEGWEQVLPGDFSLAYLPSPGMVRLRISGTGSDRTHVEATLASLMDSLLNIVRDFHFGFDQDTLEEVIGRLLLKRGLTVSTAESCTGGSISRLITRVPGSSAYFKGSLIAYSNDIKTKYLNVPAKMLLEHGAVSRPVIEQMARECRLQFDVDYAIATSGIAGPDGGTETKPVGTTWIAVAGKNGVVSDCFQFGEHRERNVLKASLAALNMLRMEVLKETITS